MSDCLYIFLDESGNFDFSPKGSPYLVLTAIVAKRPFAWVDKLACLKYDLIEKGFEIEYFHCTEDLQPIRNETFAVINKEINGIAIHSVIIEKRKTLPSLHEITDFYPKMLAMLLGYIFNSTEGKKAKEIVVITDSIPVKKKRVAVEKAVKLFMARKIGSGVSYRIYHHDSKSDFGLQVADYCCWAILKKWRDNDHRSYDLIKKAVISEFNVFASGSVYHY
jgi:hypothetical protein